MATKLEYVKDYKKDMNDITWFTKTEMGYIKNKLKVIKDVRLTSSGHIKFECWHHWDDMLYLRETTHNVTFKNLYGMLKFMGI